MLTAATDEETAFRRAIAAQPDEDVPRLAYADWLDEHDRPERAEFVRLQCELARAPGNSPVCGRRSGCNVHLWCERHDRADELLAANGAEWRRAGVCPKCWPKPGAGTGHYNVSAKCGHCFGTGDVGGLLRVVHRPPFPDNGCVVGKVVPAEFGRGFPYRVHCALADVCEEKETREVCERCKGFGSVHDYPSWDYKACPSCQERRFHLAKPRKPSPWALAVVTHHPVVEFRVDVPFDLPGRNEWRNPNSVQAASGIPLFLFDLIRGHDSSTADAAHTAMAKALGTWVRSFTEGKE